MMDKEHFCEKSGGKTTADLGPTMTKKILLIGAGPTGALVAYNLKKLTNKLSCPIEIHLWEKSRGTGGRFSTSRNPKDSSCTADLGAQYLTQNGSKPWSKPYFDALVDAGLIRNFSASVINGYRAKPDDDRQNHVCTQGTASVVKYFLQNSDINNTVFNKRVAAINVRGDKLEVVPEGETSPDTFDAVISTMPAPQILELKDIDTILSKLDPKIKTNLESVTYTSRYALGLFFSEKLEPVGGEGAANFVDGDPIIRYWTVENLKRSLGTTETSSSEVSAVVIHTTVQFGKENVDKSIDEVKEILLKHIEGKFKTLEGKVPESVKCQKWRYSQVDKGYEGSPGFVELSKSPLLIAAGDSFVESGFEGCIYSAEKTVEHLIANLK